ncbi:putative lipid-transfer protein DIR1 [Ananas comosus]|uniref:Putative lipid-transfer protein DIR1 n=1 Tax=Ananas comosus TaxID=4615 RepID=A0A199W6S4_ANACO|nr:putative lipid-transfer protein DIR1 [Ananas comosus]
MESCRHLIKLPILLAIVAVALLALLAGAADSRCRMSEKGLMACLPSVTGEAPASSPPPAECCKALKKADLPCLCGYKNSADLPKLGIKPGLAVQLPAKCKLPVPKQCM